MILFGSALVLGALGSFHCLGMCGPLALSLPRSGGSKAAYAAGRLLYNGGRVVTYGLLGMLFGLAGQSLVLAGLQRGLSILVGVLILVHLLMSLRFPVGLAKVSAGWHRALGWVKGALARRLKRTSLGSLGVIGLLNGLLPCGLVYVALAGAAATGSPWKGALYMAVFGLGTFPMMLVLSLGGTPIRNTVARRFRAAIPGMLLLVACLLIMRGLSLGIPYISPDLSGGEVLHSGCH